jgi:23S rRNA G2445 N2-methylase RlmL
MPDNPATNPADTPVTAQVSQAIDGLPISVWATGQRSAPVQRRSRYLPASTQHPARMLPAIAAHAITVYTRPGDLVLDPMCGIGTTLVEATHLGRDAIGVELEGRWADLATANLHLARTQGATGAGTVIRGDATTLPYLVPSALRGRVGLVVTSPPYGPTVHGLVRPGPGGVQKHAHRYSDQPDRRNLAHRNWTGLVNGFIKILEGCRELLRPAAPSWSPPAPGARSASWSTYPPR